MLVGVREMGSPTSPLHRQCSRLNARENAPTPQPPSPFIRTLVPSAPRPHAPVQCQDNANLTSLSLDNLVSVTGNLYVQDNALVQSLSLPLLSSIGGTIRVSRATSWALVVLGVEGLEVVDRPNHNELAPPAEGPPRRAQASMNPQHASPFRPELPIPLTVRQYVQPVADILKST
jgi:hypothetical protein